MKEGDRVSDASSQRCCSRAPASSPTLVDLDARIKATAPLVLPEISLCTTDGRPGKGDIRAQPLAPVRRRRIPLFGVDGVTISYVQTSDSCVQLAVRVVEFASAGMNRPVHSKLSLTAQRSPSLTYDQRPLLSGYLLGSHLQETTARYRHLKLRSITP